MRDERPMDDPGVAGNARAGDVEPAPATAPDAPSSPEQAATVRHDTPVARPALLRPADIEGEQLSDEEIAMYRRRVAGGFYNTREVASEVARRMIRRGDV